MRIAFSRLLIFWICTPCLMGRCSSPQGAADLTGAPERGRDQRFLFQVVRFKNEACPSLDGRNGTCYTNEECANRGGTASGVCASSFGTCCVFTIGCGATLAENCTYFVSERSANVPSGDCRVRICKCSPDICQLRLDFATFIIAGPSTRTTSLGKATFGQLVGEGKEVSDATQCLTDKFVVTGAAGNVPPMICGTNTGDHMYVNAIDGCNELSFQLGQVGIAAAIPGRQWNIKITQLSCNQENLAPPGCTQYLYGNNGNGMVNTFNYSGNPPMHLANQKQTICIRRERNKCRICWTAAMPTDFQVSGKTGMASGLITGTVCCGYGTKGTKTSGYDCVMIPGASVDMQPKANSICGRSAGLVTMKGNAPKTVCSRQTPFRLSFVSDQYEFQSDMAEGKASKGFKLVYLQTNC